MEASGYTILVAWLEVGGRCSFRGIAELRNKGRVAWLGQLRCVRCYREMVV